MLSTTSLYKCGRMYVILYFNHHIFVSHTSTKQNLFLLVIQYHSRKFNLFYSLYLVVTKWNKTHLGLKNLPLDSTLCSNSLELLVFSSHKMLWRKVTMVLRPYTRLNFKLGHFKVAESAYYQKLMVILIVG